MSTLDSLTEGRAGANIVTSHNRRTAQNYGLDEQIDNMEALSVSRNAAGETILTIMSDDNYNFFQRTLVLRFALVEK